MNLKTVGAEVILTVIIVPVIGWIIASIISLQSSFAEVKERADYNKETLREIKQNVEYIRQKLER